MKLEKFNLPAEVTHMISTLEPEHQGIVYANLFAYIYDGAAVPDDLEPRCRLIITMILQMIGKDLDRARAARNRRAYRPVDRPADRKAKFWSKREIYKYNALSVMTSDRMKINEIARKLPQARKTTEKVSVGKANTQSMLPAVVARTLDAQRRPISSKTRLRC